MWARVIEFMLACWLSLSPFILRYSDEEPTYFWASDFTCAFLIALFSLLSFWHPLRKIHLMNLGVAIWLWTLGYLNFPEVALPPQENSVAIGLLLLMLALIPNHAHLPPPSWRDFYDRG
ncbi:MAG: hypothetical protein JSS32_03725 [Verrucomicrobia bacterium]|nr:hypothetical protein [Verrucomicrobiota bacterium]